LGGLRAALYNFIYARQGLGDFILRIEDTDQKRVVPGAAEEIEKVLTWAGLSPDESPTLGGPYGPYVQSQRLTLYRDHAQELLDQGKAYRCFCSPVRLELLRKYQSRNRQKPHYDGKCRHLTPDEMKEKLAETDGNHVIRFALKPGETIFNDLVFGTIKNNLVANNEGDPIILKSDGYPTYHFANVIDDHAMKISDVIRGVEWVSSTPKHLQLYEAFGWQPPQFIHFPLVTMEGGMKMSKRFDHSHVKQLIHAGYRPTAVLNFLTNTGGGVPKEKQDSMELWSLEQMVKGFDFTKITNHAGSLDMNRLSVYNSKDMLLGWAQNPDHLVSELFDLLRNNQIECDMDKNTAKIILGNLINRLETLNDLLGDDYAFIWKIPQLTMNAESLVKAGLDPVAILRTTKEVISRVGSENKQEFESALKSLAEKHFGNYAKYMQFLRKVLTNSERGLPIFEIVQCLGVERSVSYLEHAIRHFIGQK